MNKTQEYFIHLLSTHLNNSPPLPFESEDWMGVFRLGELHNVTAILTLQIKKLPADKMPPAKIMNLFKQALGMTVQSFESKQAGFEILEETLNQNKIKHLYIKGAVLRKYYPAGEVRTSGDTDVIIKKENLQKAGEILVEKGFDLTQQNDEQRVLFYLDEEYEIECDLSGVNGKSEKLFKSPLDSDYVLSKNNLTYELKPDYHLFYVISHFLRHLMGGGVGIRQLMDVDVLLRNSPASLDKLLEIANKTDLEKSVLSVVALARNYFNTPVELDYSISENLKNKFEDIILNGGVFGFAISDNATPRMVKSINNSEKTGFKTSLKAFFMMLFPGKEYLKKTYKYSNNHPVLLPAAFFNRLFDAIFKRGKTNLNSVKGLFKNNDTALKISDIANELNIELE